MIPATPATPPTPARLPPWAARLCLGYARAGAATRLVERRHEGPLRVQKPLYPEGEGVCQTLILHPPAGIAGGDQLHISARLEADAQAQITTPGAGKWYRAGGRTASQDLVFTLEADATLEWLPQETIFFREAQARMGTTVHLAPGARYLGWEILCLGRAASGERFDRGGLALTTRLLATAPDPATPPTVLWLERGEVGELGTLTETGVAGPDPLLESPVGWAGATVSATLLAVGSPRPGCPGLTPELLAALREEIPAGPARHGLTLIPTPRGPLLVARYLGDSSEAARLWLTRLWTRLRPAWLGQAALPPRIWQT